MKSKIISIHSFRGGTGKSNITANLAGQLVTRNYRVGMVDTDIQSPGIHVLFGLDKEKMGHTLNQYLRGEATMKDVAFPVGDQIGAAPGLIQLKGKPIWLAPSSIDGSEINKILRSGYDVNILNKGMAEFRKEFDLSHLLIDTHPGINEETGINSNIPSGIAATPGGRAGIPHGAMGREGRPDENVVSPGRMC